MRATLLTRSGAPLYAADVACPSPGAGQLLPRVHACGVCRTDLHVADGELPNPKLPLVLGHEIVGRVAQRGARVEGFTEGERVGIPWPGWACGVCDQCRAGRARRGPERDSARLDRRAHRAEP